MELRGATSRGCLLGESLPVSSGIMRAESMLQEGIAVQIDNRVFIVTGASSGIGLATATALIDQGAKVALLARSTKAL